MRSELALQQLEFNLTFTVNATAAGNRVHGLNEMKNTHISIDFNENYFIIILKSNAGGTLVEQGELVMKLSDVMIVADTLVSMSAAAVDALVLPEQLTDVNCLLNTIT